MSPEARMIGAALDALGRQMAHAGRDRPEAALAPYARVLSIGICAIRTEAEIAEFGANAARRRPGGVRWILSETQRLGIAGLEDLRLRAARLLLAMAGDGAAGLLKAAADEGDLSFRPILKAALLRAGRSPAPGTLSLPALLAVLAHALGRRQ